MSLMHAILGFLSRKPQTGYDLKTEEFDRSVAHFWPADQSQIYRTLDKLTEQGLVENHVEIQQDRPNRKVYEITELGRVELARWLRTFQPVPPHREPFLVQLFFAADQPNAAILNQLRQQLAAHRSLLETYQQIEIPAPEMMPNLKWKRRVSLQRATLDAGLRLERMTIDWLQDTIKMVEGLAEK